MKIGIDARPISQPITGIGRYTYELCSALLREGQDEYFLYMPSRPSSDRYDLQAAILRHGSFHSRTSRMLWSQSALPLQAARDKVDVFWGVTHRLPSLLPSHVATVVTIHDLVWKYAAETMRPLSKAMEQLLMPAAITKADRIVAVSHSTAQGICETFPHAAHKVRAVHSGISCSSLPPDKPTFLGFDKPYFLFVGTLEPRKNLRRLLHAYAALNEQVKAQAPLVIAGGKGWGREDVAQIISALGLSDHVHVTGYVDEDTLQSLYAHALALVFPSLYEGFGLPLVEAMQYGVPVITSNCSSMPEVATDAGLYIEPYDQNSITTALAQMATNASLRDELAQKALENSKHFNWQNTASSMRVIFAEAYEEKRQNR